jgi:hypothetical protein
MIHILRYDLYTFYAIDVLCTFTIKNTYRQYILPFSAALKPSQLAFDIKLVDYMV